MRLAYKAQPSTSAGFEPEIFISGVEVLTHYACSNFGKYLEIKTIYPRNSFGNGIFGKKIVKNLLKI